MLAGGLHLGKYGGGAERALGEVQGTLLSGLDDSLRSGEQSMG